MMLNSLRHAPSALFKAGALLLSFGALSGAPLSSSQQASASNGWPARPTAHDLISPIVVADDELSQSGERRVLLRAFFEKLSVGHSSDQEKIIRLTSFLQDYMLHPLKAPVDKDGIAIYDPVWLVNHRLGQCGQTNRLLADILSAAGYNTRIVQLNGHQVAEVSYGHGWHMLDADAIDGGKVVVNRRGSIASVAEIIEDLSLLDGIVAYAEMKDYPVYALQAPFSIKSAFKRVYNQTSKMETPFVYVKTATMEQESDKYYGWIHYETLALGGPTTAP
jgi:hypothetical protein